MMISPDELQAQFPPLCDVRTRRITSTCPTCGHPIDGPPEDFQGFIWRTYCHASDRPERYHYATMRVHLYMRVEWQEPLRVWLPDA